MAAALAYLNHGRWVADCAAPDCHDARQLPVGDRTMQCVRGHRSDITWPFDPNAITGAVANRPEDKQNWWPDGHPLPALAGWPTGQTVDELREETQLFAPELGTVPIPDEDAEAIDRILRKSGLALSADLKHVREL